MLKILVTGSDGRFGKILKKCDTRKCKGKIENNVKMDKEHYGRLSLVCYLRNGMIKCKNK